MGLAKCVLEKGSHASRIDDLYLGINEADEVQQSTAFSVSGLERHLRELDVPLERFMTP